jgi:ubiquinone/menaquinone biosynthesis C-methylase UbiE
MPAIGGNLSRTFKSMSNPFNYEIERIKEAYDQRDKHGLSAQYNFSNSAFIFHMQEREWGILKMLREHKFILTDAKVLEIGCGTGHILNRFLEFGAAEASGIDLMKNRIDEAKKRYSRIKVVEGNAERLPYEDGSFDLVTQFMCFSSILDLNLRLQIAHEMWRVLKPNGLVLFYDIRPVAPILQFFGKPSKDDSKVSTSIDPLTIPEVERLFPHSKKEIRYRSISLFLKLAQWSSVSFLLAVTLSLIPLFRSHNLVVIRKLET